MTLFASSRSFSIHSYEHGHGLLLLRSPRSAEHPTQIDVLVQDVRAIELRSWFTGIEITVASLAYLDGSRSNLRDVMEAGCVVYRLAGRGWEGLVVGGQLSTTEYSGAWSDRSPLLAQDDA